MKNNNNNNNLQNYIEYTPSWSEIARDKQRIPEGDWMLWLIMAGRGFGKTRTGAESVMELVNSGKYKRIGIIGKSLQEVKKVMVEGQSGILSSTVAMRANSMKKLRKNPDNEDDTINFNYYTSKNQITWENGAVAYFIGGDDPEALRGHQFDLIWIDEFAKYRKHEELWEQVMFTLRLGDNPKCIMTTTPKPIKTLKTLCDAKFTHITKGSTFENQNNLSSIFIENIKNRYEGTRVGKQELYGDLMMEKTNTVWKKENIMYKEIDRENLSRVVVGVDPAVSCGENSDETGIIVAGIGYDEKIYVLDDLSGRYKPPEWAKIVVRACHDYQAGRVVAETNNGGDLVGEVLSAVDNHIPYHQVKAIKGKVARAEPVSMLYESNKVFHAKEFLNLEEQMCDLSYDGDSKTSPDRVDALVWAVTELRDKSRGMASCHVEML